MAPVLVWSIGLAGMLGLAAVMMVADAPAARPFTVEASDNASGDFPGAPRLQSFADGRCVHPQQRP